MRALIVNAYSTGNWGDAAIIEGMIATVRAAGFDHVEVAPVDWRMSSAGWKGLGADSVAPPLLTIADVHRLLRRPRSLRIVDDLRRLAIHRFAPGVGNDAMRAYRAADIVITAGGAYLGGNRTGGNFLKLANVRAATMIGRRTVVAPVTINPFTPMVGRLLRWGLGGAATFVRDEPSRQRLARCGVSSTLAMDLAFRAPSLVAAAAALASGDRGHRTGTLGWAPRSYRVDHQQWGRPEVAERTTLDAVRSIFAHSDARLLMFAHVRAEDGDDDRAAVDRVVACLTPAERERVEIAPDPATLRDAVAQYSGLDVLITSRMHAAIFAMAAGTPAIAVAYEPKVAGVLREVGLDDRVVPADERLTTQEMTELVARLGTSAERDRTREAFRGAMESHDEFGASLV